jgi:hypothetical protein
MCCEINAVCYSSLVSTVKVLYPFKAASLLDLEGCKAYSNNLAL